MSRDKRHRLEGFRNLDWKVMEEHYKDKASQGLFIEKFKWGISTYREGYPEDMEYSIAIYPRPKAFETVDDKKAREYVQEQEGKGWKHVSSNENMHIFTKKQGDDLQPIDKSEQIRNIRNSIKLENISFTLLFLMNTFNMRRMFPMDPSMLYSNTGLMSLIILPLITLFLLMHVMENVRVWIRIREVEDPKDFPCLNPSTLLLSRRIQIFGGLLVLAGIFIAIAVDSVLSGNMTILTILPVLVGMFVAFKLRGFFVGRDMGTVQKTVVAFVIVFVVIGLMTVINMRMIRTGFGDQLPEDYKALRLENPDSTSFRREGSLIAPRRYSYTEWSRGDRVSTEVTEYLTDSVADYLFDMELESYTRYIGEYWDAKEWYPEYDRAYFATFRDREMDDGGTIFLMKDNYIVRLSMEKDLREEEIVWEINEFVENLLKDSM